jgi:F-type H+-transporting ATPase subunit delta
VLHDNVALRHAAANPATPRDAKTALLRRLFGDRISAASFGVAETAVAQRWSSSIDLADSLAVASTEASLGVAEASGALSDVEDELFRFGRILAREPQLNLVLSDPSLSEDKKSRLVDTLLAAKVSPITVTLVRRIITSPRGLPPERAIAAVAELASQRRRQLLATVKTAVALQNEQVEQLAASLGRLYGREVHVQLDVDPTLIGGVSIRVGDEIVDGSIRHRLAEARARLTR